MNAVEKAQIVKFLQHKNEGMNLESGHMCKKMGTSDIYAIHVWANGSREHCLKHCHSGESVSSMVPERDPVSISKLEIN